MNPRATMIIGGCDTGKTTLARSLYESWLETGVRAAYLDSDLGQSSLGPPATVGLEYSGSDGKRHRYFFFVGGITPKGNFCAVVVGMRKLYGLAARRGIERIVLDTSGLVDPRQGGATLKLWKIELLCPDNIVLLQREHELETIIAGLRHYPGIVDLRYPDAGVRSRSGAERRQNRERLWRRYFRESAEISLQTGELALWDVHRAERGMLLGLESASGFCLGVGVVVSWMSGEAVIVTALKRPDRVARVRLGSIMVDPVSGKETIPYYRS